MLTQRLSFSAVVSALSLSAAALWPLQAHALFDDDEARKAIIDLRNKFDAHKQATENTLGRLTRQAEEGSASRATQSDRAVQPERAAALGDRALAGAD